MISFILALASISEPLSKPAVDIHNWALETYGPEITFDIKRKGKKIGSHSVTFDAQGDKLLIEATTKIRVKFLFITAYKFDYSSKEIWEQGHLVSLQSHTNDNGKNSSVTMGYGENSVDVIHNGEATSNQFIQPLFTTNHWNPNILNSNQVLNTITGKTNKIEISSVGMDEVPTANGERKAMHHKYSGDLMDISTWYDQHDRWVKLNFKGNDGSIISYECNKCGDE
ncbi:MAG: DUF6134 family protein [Emcibacteraceae bacterium]|nr:DUF6134 family protein [Emcibacteraceae bacterium]